jgi:hypothetical protein
VELMRYVTIDDLLAELDQGGPGLAYDINNVRH